MKENKICIVTVYNACNYGSFLQAYALQEVLKDNNYKTYFINMPVEHDKIICSDSKSEDYSEYENKKYIKLVEDQKKFEVIDKVDSSYVSCVVGSDTVWNLFDKTYSNIPYFTGKGLEECKNIISYAASVGPAKLEKLFLLKFPRLLEIRSFNHIAVRDEKTEKLVKILRKKPVRVLDPTFLKDLEEIKPQEKIDKPYILVYTYGLSDEKVEAIKKYAKENNLTIIATGSLCKWADMNIAVGSFEWLWLVKNAECVITTTFHGSIFSIKYNKNFAVLIENSSKINSLLKEFKLSDRICNEDTLIETLKSTIDYTEINKIMDERIQASKKYLLESVGENLE